MLVVIEGRDQQLFGNRDIKFVSKLEKGCDGQLTSG